MKPINLNHLYLAALLGVSLPAAAGIADITPRPVEVTHHTGAPFVIKKGTGVAISAPQADSLRLARQITELWPQTVINNSKKAKLHLVVDSTLAPEAYTVSVSKNGITISGGDGAGLFYGVQTLAQMADGDTVEPAFVRDEPRFEYRGMLMDVSRHFRDKEFVIKQLDALAKLKYNRLHMHLTDAAGWRLQIDRYPQLTKMAAWRDGDTWWTWCRKGHKYLEEGDSTAYGGYYTKDDIRDIIRYAADRYITIIPEIELPSHSEEVTAVYPLLSCTKTPYTSSDICPGSETSYEFLQNVLDETIELFPSEYIHIGGDEAPKTHWHNCPDCQARMKSEGLADVDELQSYMIRRIEKYVNSKGRKIIGWDEIMEGGVSPTATVQAWRSVEAGNEAASMGNKVVMSPGAYCYFDGYQDAPHTQPDGFGGYLTLNKVYSFDPAPETLPDSVRNNITGVEGTLFAEYIPTDEHYEYMLYPRAIALSEVAWSPAEGRDLDDFRRRAIRVASDMTGRGYKTFDLTEEVGERPESKIDVDHLAKDKPVKYTIGCWRNYPAKGETTLVDGRRGSWSYGDNRWQGFIRQDKRMDVTIDLQEKQPVKSINAEFMQVYATGVLMPRRVVISVSDDGENFTVLKTIDHEVKVTDNRPKFMDFGWEGDTECRYVRYEAYADEGALFTDEIIVK